MKALVLEAYNRLVYKEVENPVIKDYEVLVQVKAVGICGSDIHGMDGSSGRRIPPIIMGHEASGIIAALGKDVQGWNIGDRVTFDSTIYPLNDWYTLKGLYNLSENRIVLGVSCDDYRRDGAMAEFVAIPQHILYRIPDQVSFSQAAMVEPVAVALHAISLAKPLLSDSVMVIGAGMIGMFLIQLLKAAGCTKIIAIDIDDTKLSMASEMGASHAFHAELPKLMENILELTHGRGVDKCFEAIGIQAGIDLAFASIRKGGALTLLGNISRQVQFPLQAVVTRQIKVQGSCAICGEYPAVLELMEQGKINTESMLSAEVPLSEGADWFRRLYQKEKGLYKVILKPGQET